MPTIARQLPRTLTSRAIAIAAAKQKKDNPGPIGNILTAATGTRLDGIAASFGSA